MIRLLIVEVRRAMARGVTRILIGMALLGLVIMSIWVFVAVKSAETLQAERAASVKADADYAASESQHLVALCTTRMQSQYPSKPSTRFPGTTPQVAYGPAGTLDQWADVYNGTASPELIRAYCEAQSASSGSSSSYRSGSSNYYGPEVFQYTKLWPEKGDGLLEAPATMLYFGALIGGASLIGAEWQSGAFVMFLTWEPRRTRVLVAKVLAASGLAFVISIALLALFALALYPTAALKGSTEGMTAAWFQGAGAAVLRISAVTSMAAAIGSAFAMIGRRTATALIGLFAYVAIVETLISSLKPELSAMMLSFNATIFTSGRDYASRYAERSPTAAGLILLAYTVFFVTLAAAAFRRRDFAAG